MKKKMENYISINFYKSNKKKSANLYSNNFAIIFPIAKISKFIKTTWQ